MKQDKNNPAIIGDSTIGKDLLRSTVSIGEVQKLIDVLGEFIVRTRFYETISGSLGMYKDPTLDAEELLKTMKEEHGLFVTEKQ